MAENKNDVKVVEAKKGNGFVAWFNRHKEAIITGIACTAIAGTVGYVVCSAVHHEPNPTVETLDDTLENLLTAENSEIISEAIPTPEVDALQDPTV